MRQDRKDLTMKKSVVQVLFEQHSAENGVTILRIKHLLINNKEYIKELTCCDGWFNTYNYVLNVIKYNGYYVKSWYELDNKWYDIAWYDNINGGFYIAPYPDKSQNELKQIKINNKRNLK